MFARFGIHLCLFDILSIYMINSQMWLSVSLGLAVGLNNIPICYTWLHACNYLTCQGILTVLTLTNPNVAKFLARAWQHFHQVLGWTDRLICLTWLHTCAWRQQQTAPASPHHCHQSPPWLQTAGWIQSPPASCDMPLSLSHPTLNH